MIPSRYATLIALLLFPALLVAQAPVDYDDVVLIVNDASEASREIGEYFARARNIPERNIVHITAPTDETIDDAAFQALRAQIEQALTERELVDTINYLVTTKGLPLRIDRPTDNAQTSPRASVESELMLILGTSVNLIGGQGWAYHNYGFYSQRRHFYRREHGFYLVTRLDAYTVDDVKRMIDRSGPNTVIEKDSVLFVLDTDPTPIDSAFHQSQIAAAATLSSRGWPVLLNRDSVYVTDQQNVMGYASWGSNDNFSGGFSQNAKPRSTWSRGSLAETFVSTSGRSFMPGTGYGQSLIADWLAEGATGAKGYVFEPFTIALALPHVVFDRYTDESVDTAFNLAESFYMASRTVSWMEVVIGDPKASIVPAPLVAPSPALTNPEPRCAGRQPFPLQPTNLTRGLFNWFRGDSIAVKQAGPPYDRRHPLWIAEGKVLPYAYDQSGTFSYTIVNENAAGPGFAQATVTFLPVPEAGFTLSDDTVLIGEPLTATDTTVIEGQREWTVAGQASESQDRALPLVFSTAGRKEITLVVSNGECEDRMTRTVLVLDPSSVPERNEERNDVLLTLRETNRLRVVYEKIPAGEVTLRLFDVAGHVVGTWRRSASTAELEVALGRIADGTYFVELSDSHGTSYHSVLVGRKW